jgi:hypothetical protein
MILVLTTLLHVLAILPPLISNHPFRFAYSAHAIATTFLSAVWHLKGQPDGVIMYLDYSFTTIWFIYDMGLMVHLPDSNKHTILIATLCVLCLHQVCSAEQNYDVYHSLWHIASAIKCTYVSYTLFA